MSATKPPGIGIMGAAYSGKDTLATFLVSNHRYYRRAFADALKEEVGAQLFPFCSPELLVWRVNQEKHKPEMRALLQAYGVAKRVFTAEDYWVQEVFRHIKDHGIDRPVVIPDVRFPNEVDEIRERNMVLVGIYRPEHQGDIAPELTQHISERALDGVEPDILLVNNGTPYDLYAQFCGKVNELLRQRHIDAINRFVQAEY